MCAIIKFKLDQTHIYIWLHLTINLNHTINLNLNSKIMTSFSKKLRKHVNQFIGVSVLADLVCNYLDEGHIRILKMGHKASWLEHCTPNSLLSWCGQTSLRRLETNNMRIVLTTAPYTSCNQDKKTSGLVMRSLQQFEIINGKKVKQGWYIEWDSYCHYVRKEEFYKNDKLLFVRNTEMVCSPYTKKLLIYDINTGILLYKMKQDYKLGAIVINMTTGVQSVYNVDWIEDVTDVYDEMMSYAPEPMWKAETLLKPFIDQMKSLSNLLPNISDTPQR